jgi:hypothetical protein
MAKFVDINSLKEKNILDGNEKLQVSDTQYGTSIDIARLFTLINLSSDIPIPTSSTGMLETSSTLKVLKYLVSAIASNRIRIFTPITSLATLIINQYIGFAIKNPLADKVAAVVLIGSSIDYDTESFKNTTWTSFMEIDDETIMSTLKIKNISSISINRFLNTEANDGSSGSGTINEPLSNPSPYSGTDNLRTLLLKAQAFAGMRSGTDSSNRFRFICVGNLTALHPFGVLWYDSTSNKTIFVEFLGPGTSSYPANYAIKCYAATGDQWDTFISKNDSDVYGIIKNSTSVWLTIWELKGSGSSSDIKAEEVLVAAPTLFDENTSSTWDPTAANNLQELVNGLLYRIGVRITPDGRNLGFRVAQANGKIAIIANDQSSSDYSVFLFSGGSVIHTYLIDQSYVMEWIGNYSSDSDIIASIESDGSETGMLDLAGINNFATKAYVKPNDAVLTMFPSGYRTIIPGENLTTNLTSGTLKVQVPSLLTAQVKNGPFRDAVIDVPYGVTVQFADQVGIVYKADGVDGFTATSGRKVYTIHFVPTTSSTTNITFRAFVNVTNYK